jgi:hypothetical protein
MLEASGHMSAYLSTRVQGLKAIMDPIVGSVLKPVTQQLTSPIGSQMTDGLGNGAGQELKADAPGDVSFLLNAALTYNLTNLLTDAIPGLTAEKLTKEMTSAVTPRVARAVLDFTIARIHDAVTAHGVSAEARRDIGNPYSLSRQTGRRGVAPPADDGGSSKKGGNSGGAGTPPEAGTPGAFDDGTGPLQEPPREPVLVEAISNRVSCHSTAANGHCAVSGTGGSTFCMRTVAENGWLAVVIRIPHPSQRSTPHCHAFTPPSWVLLSCRSRHWSPAELCATWRAPSCPPSHAC